MLRGASPFYLLGTYFDSRLVNRFYDIPTEERTKAQSDYLRVYNLLLDVTEFRRSAVLYTFYEEDIKQLSNEAKQF